MSSNTHGRNPSGDSQQTAYASTHREDEGNNHKQQPSGSEPVQRTHHDDSVENIEMQSIDSDDESDNTALRRQSSVNILPEDDRRELQRIATAMSSRRRQSLATHPEVVEPPAGDSDPKLDPSSKEFDLGKWLQLRIQNMEGAGKSLKRAGVAYKDLSVSGTGAAMRLQQTVGSFLMAPARLGEHISFGSKKPKPILHRFDGLMKSGELLIVLGRPGSGCSTLLKTLTGELYGLDLGKESTIHYNGIPQKEMMKEFKGEATYNQEVSYPSHRHGKKQQ